MLDAVLCVVLKLEVVAGALLGSLMLGVACWESVLEPEWGGVRQVGEPARAGAQGSMGDVWAVCGSVWDRVVLWC